MVWFQCEDCGENLKKPKLPSHFRMCSATKLSCIDCGVMFGRDSVQGHNQCITEAEKYGPKGQSKPSNSTPAKPKDNSKPDFDINVGLSSRYPWFCSICYTKATSQQTLLAHADGKKHRAKAKAIHAKQQQGSEQPTVDDKKDATENDVKDDSEQKKVDLPISSGVSNGDTHTEKKRKLETLDRTGNNGDIVQSEDATGGELKKAKKQDHEKKINWKKLITSALKSNEDKTLKMKKLKKAVLESLVDSGITRDKSELKRELELKINSSSKFIVDGKYVKLVAKD